MWDFIIRIFSAIALFPFIPFALTLIGYGAVVHNRKKAIQMAMDVSTIFFIMCVSGLFNNLFNSNFGFYGILLVMVIGGGLLGNTQYRKNGKLNIKKIIRVVWRVTFFVTAFLYIIFSIISLIKLIITV